MCTNLFCFLDSKSRGGSGKISPGGALGQGGRSHGKAGELNLTLINHIVL